MSEHGCQVIYVRKCVRFLNPCEIGPFCSHVRAPDCIGGARYGAARPACLIEALSSRACEDLSVIGGRTNFGAKVARVQQISKVRYFCRRKRSNVIVESKEYPTITVDLNFDRLSKPIVERAAIRRECHR